MPTYSCCWPYLAELLGVFGDGWSTGPCERPAAFSTLMKAKREGQQGEFFTRLCAPHDSACHALPGYGDMSIRLSTRKPAPS